MFVAQPRRRPARRLAGKMILSAVAAFGPVGAFAADWNETHVFNPNWPPHAKFHNGQTLTLAGATAALSLWQLWGTREQSRSSLRWGTLFAGLYYATQAPAVLFPGAAVTDPEFADRLPVVAGVTLNQLIPLFTLLPPVLALGYWLAASGDVPGVDRSASPRS